MCMRYVQKSHLVPISENVADKILVGLLLRQNCALDHTHFFLLLLHVRIDLVCVYVRVCVRGGQLLLKAEECSAGAPKYDR